MNDMNIINLEEVDSTNSYVKANIFGLSDRTVVISEKQSCGRGRFDRKWVDFGSGNLFMSIILKPSDCFNPVYSNLTQYMSVVLCRILEDYGLEPEIKWPNDVLISGRKIAGILCETILSGSLLKGIVLGVGVNLNVDKDKLNLVKDREITALNLELSREYEDKKLFTEKLLREFFKNYDNFLHCGFSSIRDEYTKRCSFLGTKIKVKLYSDYVTGEAVNLSDTGELIVKVKGDSIALNAGDIL